MWPFIFSGLGSLLVDGKCFPFSKGLSGSLSVLTTEVLTDRGDERPIKTNPSLSELKKMKWETNVCPRLE